MDPHLELIVYMTKVNVDLDAGAFVLWNKDNETQTKKATRPLLLLITTAHHPTTGLQPNTVHRSIDYVIGQICKLCADFPCFDYRNESSANCCEPSQ